MNKQEAINKLKSKKILENCLSNYGFGYNEALDEAVSIVKQLDEPVKPPEPRPLVIEKPVIPKYVADWIEWCKKHKVTLLGSIIAICDNKNIRSLDVSGWATKNQETFTKAWFYGYKVEKEKLYRVELPNPNGDSNRYGLCKVDGRIVIGYLKFGLNKAVNTKLTETEIKKDFEWAWKWAKEV